MAVKRQSAHGRGQRRRDPQSDVAEQLKQLNARVRFEDRRRRMNADPSLPRWTAFVSVLGHDVVGEGSTKPEAVREALRGLPPHVARHFARDPQRPSVRVTSLKPLGSGTAGRLADLRDDAARKLGYYPLFVVFVTRDTQGYGEKPDIITATGTRAIAEELLEELRREGQPAYMWKEWQRGIDRLRARAAELREPPPWRWARKPPSRRKKAARRDPPRHTKATSATSNGHGHPRHVYRVGPFDERELATLEWLAARGYDGGFLDLARRSGLERELPDGRIEFGLYEPEAWEFNDNVDQDPDAFLASSGSQTLNEKMLRLLDSII